MPGGGDPGGGGVQATNFGRGTHVPGAIEVTGSVPGVRVVDGGVIFGGSQDDTTWASARRETELENLRHRGRSTDVLHGLPGQGTPAEMPGGGIPRKSGDEDGNAGSFSAPESPGHRGSFVGGKPPHPQCPKCDMLVPWLTLNGTHPTSVQ